MDTNKISLIIYMPCLHPELAIGVLPQEVLFINPGLPKISLPEEKSYNSDKLVFTPEQAQACLNDLMAYEETVEDLSAASAAIIVDQFWGQLTPVESADLKDFVASAGSKSQDSLDSSLEKLRYEVYEQSQKNLLLAWNQEESFITIRKLLGDIGVSSHNLMQSIQEPDGEYDTEAALTKSATAVDGMVDLIMQETGLSGQDLRPDWSAAFIGALCLTDPDTVFYSSYKDLKSLLNTLCEDENSFPPFEELSAADTVKFFPHSGKEGCKFSVCKVSYSLLASNYKSPLLKRLLWLDGNVRKDISIIFEQ